MKRTRWFLSVTVMVLAMAMTAALAEPPPLVGFAGQGIGASGAKSNFIVSANCANGGVARLLYINATGGNADNLTTFYGPDGRTAVITNLAASTTQLPVSVTNGWIANDIVVIRHRTNDTYEAAVIVASTNNVLGISAAVTATVFPGDIVYGMELVNTFTHGTSKELSAPSGFFIARRRGPVLLRASGTSVGVTGYQAVSGDYIK